MEETRKQFFTQLCAKFGWEPTVWRLNVFDTWASQEGMPSDLSRHYNPLATTRTDDALSYSKENKGYGAGNWNSVPVKLYATFEDGVLATYQTLKLPYYPNIRQAMDTQTHVDCYRDFTSWVGSTHMGYITAVQDAMRLPALPTENGAGTYVWKNLDASLRHLIAVFGGAKALEEWANKGNVVQLGLGITQEKVGDLEVRSTELTNAVHRLERMVARLDNDGV